MEAENLNPQMSSQPIPPVHFSKGAVIFGVAFIAFVSFFVVGAILYFKNSKPMTKEQPRTIIYGERHKNPYDIDNGSIIIYSVNSNTKIQRELFKILIADYISLYDIKFCAATNKIYIRYPNAGVKLNVADNLFVKEIDLTGKIRDLDFTGMTLPEYKHLESSDRGFVLSNDCQKIVWSTLYYDQINKKEQIRDIVFADINGGNKKILQTIKQSPNDNGSPKTDDLVKIPYSWSATNPNIVYLTNPGNKSGGLFRLELNTNSISQINAVRTDEIIMDISNNDNFIVHRSENVVPKSFVTNLANNSTVPMSNGSSKDIVVSKFSPDSSKLAYTALDYSTNSFACPLKLYIFDPVKKIDKLVTKIPHVCVTTVNALMENQFIVWLTNDTVIYVKDGSDLVLVNVNDGKETELTPVSGELLFVGVSDK